MAILLGLLTVTETCMCIQCVWLEHFSWMGWLMMGKASKSHKDSCAFTSLTGISEVLQLRKARNAT